MDDTLIDWSGRTVDWIDYRRTHLQSVFDFVCAEVHPLADSKLDPFVEAAVQHIERGWTESAVSLISPNIGTSIALALRDVGVPPEKINRERVLRAYEWGPVTGVTVFPDALEVLPILRQHGIQITIITNSSQPMWMRDIELEAFGLLKWIDGPRISAADVGYLKPHPAIFGAALDSLRIGADETVMVGDNPRADVQGGQGVGIKSILRQLADGSNQYHSATPDATIDTLHDLLPILDVWFPDWRR
jgi:putative hydrolase of the HAD superfamily